MSLGREEKKKTPTTGPLYRRIAGWGLAGSAGGILYVFGADAWAVPLPLEVYNFWDQSTLPAQSQPCNETSTCSCLLCIDGDGCETLGSQAWKSQSAKAFCLQTECSACFFPSSRGTAQGRRHAPAPALGGMGGRGGGRSRAPTLEGGLELGERPERGEGQRGLRLASVLGAHRPRRLETPSLAVEARVGQAPPGTAREAHLAWSSAAATWAGGGAGRGTLGLAVSLASARQALATGPGLAFTAPTAQPPFLHSCSMKKRGSHWNLPACPLPSRWPGSHTAHGDAGQRTTGREGGRLGPASDRQRAPPLLAGRTPGGAETSNPNRAI